MAIVPFLAMTAAEMNQNPVLPKKIAWMGCHFSPYGMGLSNLPKRLPRGALLMVDDVTPPHRHDPVFIGSQLKEYVEEFRCRGVLLDFQRPTCEETVAIADHLISTLPCPVMVSECYAKDLDCPVFLPPVPPSVALAAHLAPWKGREIWLEIGLDGEILTLTEHGCEVAPLPCPDQDAEGFSEETLHCHYSIEAKENAASFTLWRTKDDLDALIEEAETFGVSGFVGLYQELGNALPSREGGSRNS